MSSELETVKGRSTDLLSTPHGEVEYLVTGAGAPVTVFAHGLAGAIDDIRPLAGGVRGTRVLSHFFGHGRSTWITNGEGEPGYRELAEQLAAVATHVGATRALGVSLGAATILRMLHDAAVAGVEQQFERVVLFLPASMDRPRPPDAVAIHARVADRLSAGDPDGLATALTAIQPRAVRELPEVRDWATRRAAWLLASADPSTWPSLASRAAISDHRALRHVTVPTLVIAQEGDDAHPVEVARAIAEALPRARLVVFDESGALWGHRRDLRILITSHLND